MAGLCPGCRTPDVTPEPGRTLCAACLDRHATRMLSTEAAVVEVAVRKAANKQFARLHGVLAHPASVRNHLLHAVDGALLALRTVLIHAGAATFDNLTELHRASLLIGAVYQQHLEMCFDGCVDDVRRGLLQRFAAPKSQEPN